MNDHHRSEGVQGYAVMVTGSLLVVNGGMTGQPPLTRRLLVELLGSAFPPGDRAEQNPVALSAQSRARPKQGPYGSARSNAVPGIEER